MSAVPVASIDKPGDSGPEELIDLSKVSGGAGTRASRCLLPLKIPVPPTPAPNLPPALKTSFKEDSQLIAGLGLPVWVSLSGTGFHEVSSVRDAALVNPALSNKTQ